jgi:phosphatidylinositol kinase/protein kinase (PI-3  family)
MKMISLLLVTFFLDFLDIPFRILISSFVDEDAGNKADGLNARALTVINRVSNKLTGRDFKPTVTLDVSSQVQKLIMQATSMENLCQV